LNSAPAAASHENVPICANRAPALLGRRFRDVADHADVVTLPALPAETALVAAGFPCQDLSRAGRTVGIGGARPTGCVSSRVFWSAWSGTAR